MKIITIKEVKRELAKYGKVKKEHNGYTIQLGVHKCWSKDLETLLELVERITKFGR